jgi:uncharacterized membrane protein
MKNAMMFLIIFFIVQVTPVFAQSKEIGTDVGRFQLFQGKYKFVNIDGEELWQEGLFKIDTKTGRIFICEKRQHDGKYEKKPGHIIQRTKCKPFEEEIVSPK